MSPLRCLLLSLPRHPRRLHLPSLTSFSLCTSPSLSRRCRFRLHFSPTSLPFSSSFSSSSLADEDSTCERIRDAANSARPDAFGHQPFSISSPPPQAIIPSPAFEPTDVHPQQEPYIIEGSEVESSVSEPAPFGEPTDIYIPVKAFFISRRINLKGLQEEEFMGTISSRNHLIIKWKDRPPGCPPVTAKLDMQAMSSWSCARYLVVFNYGSVVLFNFGENEEDQCLDVIRNHCSEACQEAKKDDFDIIVRPTLEGWCLGGHDKVLLKKLNTDNIRIVASILGQSIALDHYGKKVDALVTIFSDLNQKMEKTGTFTMKRSALFRVVATANTTLADVILRLGLLERSDAAWKDANYAALWEFLREEYELDERFESFDFKLEIIQHNVRFFLEVLQNRKSDTLEWIIILLIAGEICVSLYEILHGTGVLQ